MEAFQAIESLPVVRLLKASYLVYPLISAAHIAAIGTLLTSVALMDLRLIGAITSFPETPYVALLRRLALSAFGVAAATGFLMFCVRASHYAQLPVFLAKMALIGLAGMNFLLFSLLSARDARGTRLLAGVSLRVSVEVGSTSMTLAELLALSEGSVVELDRAANELLDIYANGTLIAKGEIVSVDGRYGIQIAEVVAPAQGFAGFERRG